MYTKQTWYEVEERSFIIGFLQAKSYFMEETGGGCIAYFKYLDDGDTNRDFFCLTNEDLGPINKVDNVTLGFYRDWDKQDYDIVYSGPFEGVIKFL